MMRKGMPLRSISSAYRPGRKRTLVALASAVSGLAVVPAAGAVTLSGSGSSAAQPYMLKLFKGYSRIHRNVHFHYIPNGGNAGVQDEHEHRQQHHDHRNDQRAEG